MRSLKIALIAFVLFTACAWRPKSAPVPNPTRFAGIGLVQTWGFGIVLCGALKPMIASALRERELTLKEAYAEVADCLLPFVGSWLVRTHFPDEWDKLPMKRHRLEFGIGEYS